MISRKKFQCSTPIRLEAQQHSSREAIDESDSSIEEVKEAPSRRLSGNNYLIKKTGKPLIDEDMDEKQESKRVSYDGP